MCHGLSYRDPVAALCWRCAGAGLCVAQVVGSNFNTIALGPKLCFLATFGYPCPDCQFAHPPIHAASNRYHHMADKVQFGYMNTGQPAPAPVPAEQFFGSLRYPALALRWSCSDEPSQRDCGRHEDDTLVRAAAFQMPFSRSSWPSVVHAARPPRLAELAARCLSLSRALVG